MPTLERMSALEWFLGPVIRTGIGKREEDAELALETWRGFVLQFRILASQQESAGALERLSDLAEMPIRWDPYLNIGKGPAGPHPLRHSTPRVSPDNFVCQKLDVRPLGSYDPRMETVEVLPYNEYQDPYNDYPVKTYRPGPGTPTGLGGAMLGSGAYPSRPTSTSPGMYRGSSNRHGASSARYLSSDPHYGASTQAFHQDDLTPKFLGSDGRWVQEMVPMPIAAAQSQPLTTSETFSARLPGTYGRSIRPVSAVVSYNDVSP
eukprot:gene1345-32705_t